jgi:hypothetical protein
LCPVGCYETSRWFTTWGYHGCDIAQALWTHYSSSTMGCLCLSTKVWMCWGTMGDVCLSIMDAVLLEHF